MQLVFLTWSKLLFVCKVGLRAVVVDLDIAVHLVFRIIRVFVVFQCACSVIVPMKFKDAYPPRLSVPLLLLLLPLPLRAVLTPLYMHGSV